MKNFKIFSKKGVCLLLVLALTIACIGPIAKVWATTHGEGDNRLKVEVNNDLDFEITNITVNGVMLEDDEDEFATEDGKYVVVIELLKNGDVAPDIQWGGNWNGNITKEVDIAENGSKYTYTLRVTNPEPQGFVGLSVIEKQEDINPQPQPNQPGDNQPGDNKISVDFGTAQWVINGITVSVTIPFVGTPNNGPVELNRNDQFRVSNFDPNTMEMIVTAEDGFNTKLSLLPNTDHETTLNTADCDGLPGVLTFGVIKKQNDGENNEEPYVGERENIEFNIKFTNTHVNIWINGINVVQTAGNDDETQFEGIKEGAGTTNPTETNTLRFQTEFGDFPVREYTINGKVYKEGDDNVTVNNDEFIVVVPGAEKYTITGKGDSSAIVERTIIWTNPNYVPSDAADEEWIQEFKLEHGYAYVTAVYDDEGKLVNSNSYKSENWVVNENGGGVGSNGFGWIALYPGSRVVFEFVPEYGYQLTDIRINGQKLGVASKINQFEFIMPNTNIHFDAEFTKTSDIVEAGSKDVASGEIALGQKLEGGSARLTVNDVELSEEQISNFEDNAEGYSISNYLNIELFNIYYKGKNDANDVWKKQITDLEKEATITLQLEEGVDGNEIVIVHEKHDGTYEIIPATYDAENHTITFKTSSFSNYAIASKTVEEEETEIAKEDSQKEDINKEDNQSSNPQTGDIIYKVSSVLAVAIGVFAISFILAKNGKKKERKH